MQKTDEARGTSVRDTKQLIAQDGGSHGCRNREVTAADWIICERLQHTSSGSTNSDDRIRMIHPGKRRLTLHVFLPSEVYELGYPYTARTNAGRSVMAQRSVHIWVANSTSAICEVTANFTRMSVRMNDDVEPHGTNAVTKIVEEEITVEVMPRVNNFKPGWIDQADQHTRSLGYAIQPLSAYPGRTRISIFASSTGGSATGGNATGGNSSSDSSSGSSSSASAAAAAGTGTAQ